MASSDYEFSGSDGEEGTFYDEDAQMSDGQDQDSSASEDEMQMSITDDFRVNIAKEKAKVHETPHECLSVEAIEDALRKDVEHVMSIFSVDIDTASLLLRHMNWNKERLIEKYMDSAPAVNKAAGISTGSGAEDVSAISVIDDNSKAAGSRSREQPRRATRSTTSRSNEPSSSKGRSSEPLTCSICCIEDPPSSYSLSCKHAFCSDCWTMYVTSKVREEGECSMTCMASDCSLALSDTFISKAIDPRTFARFKELVVRSYVAQQPYLKFCPAPSCSYTVKCVAAALKASLSKHVPIVLCGEKHTFCFGCSIDADHRPCACNVAKLWLKKCQDDSETANWIKSNTKECSKCQSTIEKNGGCNHMTCRKCKYEFCWVCMGPWSEHGTAWYSCNRFDESAGVEARDAQTRSRASLERYLHYYNRWANHEQSAKLSKELYVRTEKKMEEMQITSDLTWIEVQFAKKAVEEVDRCRMTLKWTYAMAYYLEKSNEKELFEDNQRDLERAVEDLSELLEQNIDAEAIVDLRQKMTDKTVYVQKRNEIMLEDTAKGFLEGRWKWNTPVEGFEDSDDDEGISMDGDDD